MTLSKPDLSLPKLLTCLKIVGSYSGYKPNIYKTPIITCNYTPTSQVQNLYKFYWDNENIHYLGIAIPKKLSNIYAANFLPITKQIKSELNRFVSPRRYYQNEDLTKIIIPLSINTYRNTS